LATGGTHDSTACVPARSAPATWHVSSDGVLIRGQTPAQSPVGVSFSNYTLSFLTKIVRGGTGWRAAAGIGYGPYLLLTSDYPDNSTFANINRTVVALYMLVFTYGYGIINQTGLTSAPR
jgi:hypothetical protein